MPMAKEKDDRRVKYTKMILKQTLITLLQQKPVDKITVKEICDLADLNRSTFYAHFKDPHDLLRQIEEELMGELNTHLKKLTFVGDENETFQLMKTIFEYVVDNADLCRALMGEYGDISFQKEIMMIIQEQKMEEWMHHERFDPELVEYFTLFSVNGSIGVIQKWLQSGMKKSASEMADLIMKLTYQGLSNCINENISSVKARKDLKM